MSFFDKLFFPVVRVIQKFTLMVNIHRIYRYFNGSPSLYHFFGHSLFLFRIDYLKKGKCCNKWISHFPQSSFIHLLTLKKWNNYYLSIITNTFIHITTTPFKLRCRSIALMHVLSLFKLVHIETMLLKLCGWDNWKLSLLNVSMHYKNTRSSKLFRAQYSQARASLASSH